MSADNAPEAHEQFFLSQGEDAPTAPVLEKRLHLKGIAEEVKRSGQFMLPRAVLPAIHALAEDETWEVRQDVAELLLFVPMEDFPSLAGLLTNDSNGYVRRSAERALERRREADLGAKRASRGIEQLSRQYESLVKQAGSQAVAEQAIKLAEARFSLLANAIVHDLLNLLTPLKSQAGALARTLPGKNTELHQLAGQLCDGLEFIERSIRDAEIYARDLPVERRPEWLHEVIHQAKDLAIENLKSYGLDVGAIQIDVGEVAEIRIEVSRQLIVQAITNILKNACESLIDEEQVCRGIITISAQAREENVTVVVSDNGRGLTSKELASLRAFLPGRKDNKKPHSTPRLRKMSPRRRRMSLRWHRPMSSGPLKSGTTA